jgi:hypothetical protein
MSFSYKTLNSTDITLTSYIANKQWEVNNSTLSSKGITVYIGENFPVNSTNPFNPISDTQTSHNEYRRLIFQSIKHLYYQNYISGSSTGQFFNSSSYFNYEQSTLVSGTIRNITTIIGSNLNPSNPVLYDNPSSQSLYDSIPTVYDLDNLDPDEGSRIAVISIDKNIYGSGLSPNSVYISGSTYLIQDDGEGNMIDTLTSTYIGNIFYSQGLIVITNQNYLCIFGVPPTTVNDYFSYVNTETPNKTLDILGNDFADCGLPNYDSFLASTYPGYSFPNYTQVGGIITITPDQSSVIPGEYKLNYTMTNNSGIRSNTSSINLTITSQSLEIFNVISSSTCYGTSSITPVTYSINYGVPYYSYSLDGGVSYTGSNSLSSITVSGSILSSTSSKVYAKDYFGAITTASFSSWYPIPFALTFLSSSAALCGSTGTTTIQINSGYSAVSASVNGGAYKKLPNTFDNATTSSTILYKDIYGCVVSSTFNLGYIPPITASYSTSSITCYGYLNGTATFSFTNAFQEPYYEFYGDDVLINDSYLPPTVNNSSSLTLSNLSSGIDYQLTIYPSAGGTLCSNQNYYTTFTLTQPTQLTLSTTASYQSTCSNAISYSIAGGTPPYTFRAIDTGSNISYSTDTSPLLLPNLSGSTYSFIVTDANGCNITGSLLTVYGRTYIYSGSTCLQA